MTAEMQNEPKTDETHSATPTNRGRLYALAAVGALLAIGAAAAIGFLGRDTGPVIASAGIVQGDVRIRAAGNDNWRQLGSVAAPLTAGTSLRATSSGRIALDLPAQGSLRLDASTQVTLAGERDVELTSGTIYVDSGTDPAAPPLVITTDFGMIHAIDAQVAVAVGADAAARSGGVRPAAASAGI